MYKVYMDLGLFGMGFNLKKKMDIYDIRVAEITEQYIGYLKEMGELNVEVSSEFIVLAAVLIRLKSHMLLFMMFRCNEITVVAGNRMAVRIMPVNDGVI